MIIKEINISNFGKFHNKVIKFEKGMNIVYGENEAGKTTLHTFIRGMLFGIEKTRGRATYRDTYSRYEPWDNPTHYAGSMRIEAQGRPYRIERNFNKDNKSCKVIDELDGRELIQDEIDELFQGFDENCYYNTISISQLGSTTDKELETILKNYAANLGATKSTELDMKAAIDDLKAKKKETFSLNKIASKMELKLRHKEIRDEIEILKKEEQEINEQIIKDKATCGQLTGEHTRLTSLENNRNEEIFKKQGKLDSMKIHYESLKVEIEQLKNTLEKVRKQESERKERLADADAKDMEDLEIKEAKIRKKSVLPNISYILLIVALIGVSVAGLVLDGMEYKLPIPLNSEYYFRVSIGAVAAAFLLLVMAVVIVKEKGRKKENALEDIEELKTILLELQNMKMDISDREGVIQRKTKELYSLHEEMHDQTKVVVGSGSYQSDIDKLQEEISTLSSNISRFNWIIEQKQVKEGELSAELENIETQLKKIDAAETEIQAIDLAINTIEDIAVEVRESFGKQLNEAASEYITNITNGKYTNLIIDDKLNVTVNSKDRLIHAEHLSKGTLEQIYMALRLAAAKIFFEKDSKPLLMDDAFAMYDNKRMAGTLKFMEKQIDQSIIFSCHTREKVLADKLGINYNLIQLAKA